MTELHTPPYVMNIGPQHPSTHGVFRLKVTLDGERIIDADMVLGYLHRSMEKLAEERTFTQNIPFTDRMDYLAAMTGNLANRADIMPFQAPFWHRPPLRQALPRLRWPGRR